MNRKSTTSITAKTVAKSTANCMPKSKTPLACEIRDPIIGRIRIIATDCADLLVFTCCDTAITKDIDKNTINGSSKTPTSNQLTFGNTYSRQIYRLYVFWPFPFFSIDTNDNIRPPLNSR